MRQLWSLAWAGALVLHAGAAGAQAAPIEESAESAKAPKQPRRVWGTDKSSVRHWHSRYGVMLPAHELGTRGSRFYTGGPRLGMWTNFELRISPWNDTCGFYMGVALQLEYEFASHSPYKSGVKTELIIWELLPRANVGYHLGSTTLGLSLYGHAGLGGQRLRGRAWSPTEPVLEAGQQGFVGQAGIGSAFSFLRNRLEVLLETGIEKSSPVTVQHNDGTRAFVLPPLDPSSIYIRAGVGLGF